MTGPGGVGSAAEEALRLLAAAEQWARSRAPLLDAQHLATGAPECTVCPVCQAVALVRGVRPEAAEHLLSAAGSLVAALQAVLQPPAGGPAEDGRRPPGVQRVRLDPDPPEEERERDRRRQHDDVHEREERRWP